MLDVWNCIGVSCVCRGRGVDQAVFALYPLVWLLLLGMWLHALQVATGLPVCIPVPTIAEPARTVHIVPFLMRALNDGGYCGHTARWVPWVPPLRILYALGGRERIPRPNCTKTCMCSCVCIDASVQVAVVLFAGVCVAGTLADKSLVKWASQDTQRSMVEIGLRCTVPDPRKRQIDIAYAMLCSLADAMPIDAHAVVVR